jgi:signal transduction histidine kinase
VTAPHPEEAHTDHMETRRVIARLGRQVRNRLLVMVGLASFVVALYVVVVLGGGAIIGRTDSPSLALSVVATAAVALLFAPVQAGLDQVAARMGHGAAATPYDVLSRGSETVTGGYATEELPSRMSMLLAQGTGAQWARVWLTVSDRLTLAATWPVDAEDGRSPPSSQLDGVDATGNGQRALAVRHGGQLLGVLHLQERPGLALTAVEERLFAGLAAQAGLVLRVVGLRAELEDRHAELMARADELLASRKRLIETQDAERRRLERDIHDGAQQHLVALTVNLRLAQKIADRSPERAALLLAQQADAAHVAIETLSSLSRGIYPRLLADKGLVPALRSAVATSPIPVTIETVTMVRLPAPVEAALYFCCMEAVQNAAKHSGARSVSVRFGEEQGLCRLTITDNGAGFDPRQALASGAGAGLANMRDRLDAVGGTVIVTSQSGIGTTVTAAAPRAEDLVPDRTLVSVPSWVG